MNVRIECFLMFMIFAFGLSACSKPVPIRTPAPTFNKPTFSDAEAVWRNATLAIPVRGSAGSMITTNDGALGLLHLAGAKPNTRWPVIVMLGGCAENISLRLMRGLAEQGFVAFYLDSKARSHEPVVCVEGEPIFDRLMRNSRYREAELTYALNELQFVSWADQKNLFLLGAGEGGAIVARRADPAVKARIVAEWGCGGDLSVSGLKGEERSPVFSVTSGNSQAKADEGCSMYMRNRALSQSLSLQGRYPNGILLEPIVFTQMLQFLDRQLFQ
ncbi:MAG: hypothetical protein V7727_08485 [Sneathiella sp.]